MSDADSDTIVNESTGIPGQPTFRGGRGPGIFPAHRNSCTWAAVGYGRKTFRSTGGHLFVRTIPLRAFQNAKSSQACIVAASPDAEQNADEAAEYWARL
jgi:hypothetical protein